MRSKFQFGGLSNFFFFNSKISKNSKLSKNGKNTNIYKLLKITNRNTSEFSEILRRILTRYLISENEKILKNTYEVL